MNNKILLSLCLVFAFITMSANTFVNDSQRKVVLTPEFVKKVNAYECLGPFSDGYAAVMRYGKWGYINIDGDEVIPCRYEAAGEFGNGLAPVAINNYGSGGIYKWGYVNIKGEVVIPYKYSHAQCFREGLAIVYRYDDNEYTMECIDVDGNRVFKQPSFSENFEYKTPFSEGLAAFCNYNKICFINKKGEKVFETSIDGEWLMEGEGIREELLIAECSFYNGEVYIPKSNNDGLHYYNVYNKRGRKLRTAKTITRLGGYEFYSKRLCKLKEWGGIYEYGIRKRNKNGAVINITNAIYEKPYWGESCPKFANGLLYVSLVEYAKDYFYEACDLNRYEYITVHYGYVDENGNDTFSPELKERCQRSLDQAIKWYKSLDSQY